MDTPLPLDKLSLGTIDQDSSSDGVTKKLIYVALVATGSFNPPTYMHLRMFELAKDALNSEGYYVIGGYMSPVNDAYKKKGLISAEHRIQMCDLACKSSSLIMVDSWEAKQSSFQRTLTVLARIQSCLSESGLISRDYYFACSYHGDKPTQVVGGFSDAQGDQGIWMPRLHLGSLRVMLVCGSDLLESFSIPGAWIREQVRSICRDYGVVCIRREGKDVEKIVSSDDILNENKNNIKIVDELIPNQISSTRVRECISKGLSVKYLTADEVIDYIRKEHLYSKLL